MKKNLIFAIRYIFYISTLLYLDNNLSIIIALLLMLILHLDNKKYIILPLILIPFLSDLYKLILIINFIIILIFNKFIIKNRYYSLITFLMLITANNFYFYYINTFTIDCLYISLAALIIYGVINMLYIYYHKNNKSYTISINDNLINLVICLGYLLLIFFYKLDNNLYYLLFMQLFIINDVKYNSLFFIIISLLNMFINKDLNPILLSYLSTSFIPPSIIITLDFNNLISYYYLLYSIIICLLRINKNKPTIEIDYISNLFIDFKAYLDKISYEYEKLNTIKSMRENQLLLIQEKYCNNCNKTSLCKTKLDKRFSFLCNAMNNDNNNIYDCPYYDSFYFIENINVGTHNIQFNAINNLALELEYLYIQNLKNKASYNKLFQDLSFYNYEILKIDISLNSPTIYFSLTLSKKKQIANELFLRLAIKAFNEKLEIKSIENEDNYIIHIYKRPKAKLDFSHKILPKNENIISGDNYYIKKNYNESYIFALSDGMGSGYKAFLESSDILRIISNLLNYHFSLKTILRLLEGIYDLKCDFDSYATLDILNINTSNMKLNLYKLGSTTTYIYHNNELLAYENKALPLKLDDINSYYEIEYFIGDIIILLSDGISDYYSKDELEDSIDFNLGSNEIVNNIINNLLEKQNNILLDDASIIVIKIV